MNTSAPCPESFIVHHASSKKLDRASPLLSEIFFDFKVPSIVKASSAVACLSWAYKELAGNHRLPDRNRISNRAVRVVGRNLVLSMAVKISGNGVVAIIYH